MKYLLRLTVLPFVFPLMVISFIYQAIAKCISFVRYGGEFVQYVADDRQTIRDMMEMFKQSKNVK